MRLVHIMQNILIVIYALSKDKILGRFKLARLRLFLIYEDSFFEHGL